MNETGGSERVGLPVVSARCRPLGENGQGIDTLADAQKFHLHVASTLGRRTSVEASIGR